MASTRQIICLSLSAVGMSMSGLSGVTHKFFTRRCAANRRNKTMSTTKITDGLSIERLFTKTGSDGFDGVEFEIREALIQSNFGKVVFEQKNVEIPLTWSQTATNIVASKYFHGTLGTAGREFSVKQLIGRVVSTIVNYGLYAGYFQTMEAADDYKAELTFLLVNQFAAFNSPVWFNVGCDSLEPDNKGGSWHWNADIDKNVVEYGQSGYKTPQCSACFINSVQDSMSSILDLAKTEGMLFKWGSGAGTNLSVIRGSNEQLSGGGTASGPLSFMKGFDAFAGVIKSGGKTRRAAKMVILDADHPDIEDFIAAKGKEEKKAQALIREGYDGNGPDSEAYSSIFFQNANNSVRVTDEFMQAAEEGRDWELKARVGGAVTKTVKAADILRQIAEETWLSGDPGMQFDTTINKWHTSKVSGRINASNPCSEYMFLDDSACNLASFNLVKFLRPDGEFDTNRFTAAVRLFIIAQDILVDMSGYPTEAIARNSHDFRPLGLGYANLGALLMNLGLPYDSEEGRAMAAAITSLMGGAANLASAEIASKLPRLEAAGDLDNFSDTGSFPAYYMNSESFLEVMAMHEEAAGKLGASSRGQSILISASALYLWREAIQLGKQYGYRNAQVTVLAPTGTIGFLMDCDTTGIEPNMGIVSFKKLVGGGHMTLANGAVTPALSRLGYSEREIAGIIAHIEAQGTIEGAPGLQDAHLPVFDGAFTPANGVRSIRWQGHVDMMAAVQPFLSGAISKTVNLPADASVEDIAAAYTMAWKKGLKAIAIYRDGSKSAQPVSLTRESTNSPVAAEPVQTPTSIVPDLNAPPNAQRHRLQDDRMALTHKFSFGGHEGYLTVGLYPNGQPGEVFIRMSKEGSTISGLMDSFAMIVSVALQHGVPLTSICDKLAHTRFEPSGWTGNEKMGYAKSPMDYIGRWLQHRFLEGEQLDLFVPTAAAAAVPGATTAVSVVPETASANKRFGDAPMCGVCGSLMKNAGSCFSCPSCGGTSGCS
jgi:ribonucleoside-diphosphate reductase alpha chain